MSKEQLEHFRQILNTWKRDLMQEVDRTVLHMKDEAANFPDPNDRATQESEFSLELRTRDRERKLIRKIEEAIKRIEDGSYGYCVETGEEIGIKRLEARPVATLCVEAQERRERREKQYGDRRRSLPTKKRPHAVAATIRVSPRRDQCRSHAAGRTPRYRGRFAPSPTGPCTSARWSLRSAAISTRRHAGGDWLVRIEDLDPPREVPGSAEQIVATLAAFGFEWTESITAAERQRRDAYQAALEQLLPPGRAFPCSCSRAELQAAQPPRRDQTAMSCTIPVGAATGCGRRTGRSPSASGSSDRHDRIRRRDPGIADLRSDRTTAATS